METPPLAGWTGRQAVELYVRTYTTMLQSSGDIKIDSLVHAHLSMASVLHPLAVLIASPSDIDDLVPTLVAYQIEWNKLHGLLQDVPLNDNDARRASGAGEGDWERLRQAWGDDFDANLAAIKRDECRIVIRLI